MIKIEFKDLFNCIKRNIKIVLLICLLIAFLIYKFFDKGRIVDGYVSASQQNGNYYNEKNDSYVVEVKGEVNRPGLYIVTKDSRISDIIDLALGFTENADNSSINLAEKISDGMLIVINKKNNNFENNKISINLATVEELQKIPNIGKSKANNIVEYRERNGGFKTIEEITNVSGISKNLFEQIKEYICL